MATLLVVGVMDDARADIQGNGQVQLTFAERLSQVCQHLDVSSLLPSQSNC